MKQGVWETMKQSAYLEIFCHNLLTRADLSNLFLISQLIIATSLPIVLFAASTKRFKPLRISHKLRQRGQWKENDIKIPP